MFSADLSWTEPGTEKVGERRERLARERNTPSLPPSVRSSKSSQSSVTYDRELWWTSGLKKAKALKPIRRSRTGTNRSSDSQKPSISAPSGSAQHGHSKSASSERVLQKLEIEPPLNLGDPTLQPSWTYASTLSPTLPSGASLDPPVCDIPELEGDISSRGTNSSGSRSSHERQWTRRPSIKVKVIDELNEVQQLSPGSFVARTIRKSTESAEEEQDEEVNTTPSPKSAKKKPRPYSVKIEGALDFEGLKLQEQPEEVISTTPIESAKEPSHAGGLAEPNLVAWKPPSDWDILLPKQPIQEKQLPPTPAESEVTVAPCSTLELTRFQRFIRRMESAGTKVILDRLKEEWHDPADAEADEELALEKQLWVLTAFQMQNLSNLRTAPRPKCDTGKILELYGNLSEVYQLSAMHPRQTVHYLTTKPQRPIPLPGNVSYLTVREPGAVPLPYPEDYFSHIRASTLPSSIPSASLPQLFGECYKLLAPGGMLEMRIMDAAPVRKTVGPKMRMWIEDRLSLNLEKLFRCSRPCMLVSNWLVDAGFELSNARDGDQMMRLPCTFDKESLDVDAELSMLIGQALWKAMWGDYVDDIPGEPKWWWEDEEVMQECLERRTVFECGAVFAYKK